MAVPAWTYTLTPPGPRKGLSVPAMLREWHRGALLGMELSRVEVDGVELDPVRVMMLNVWIQAGGAWNASRQNYFEAWARLHRVLDGPPPKLKRRRRPRRDGREGS